MGGQACVFYGATEFSRDTDFAILADPRNLTRLRAALKDLQARVIAVPPFDVRFLRRGHAIHFRCRHPEALGMRIDVMSRMRGCQAPNLYSDVNNNCDDCEQHPPYLGSSMRYKETDNSVRQRETGRAADALRPQGQR